MRGLRALKIRCLSRADQEKFHGDEGDGFTFFDAVPDAWGPDVLKMTTTSAEVRNTRLHALDEKLVKRQML